MIFGVNSDIHVAALDNSMAGIGSGLVVMYGFLVGKRLDGPTAVFLITTVLTSLTGFGFPFDHLLPSTLSASFRWWCWQLRFRRAMSSTLPAHGVGSM